MLVTIGTHIERGQTVPAEDVLASFAHHLSASFVLFDRYGAHRTALDQLRVESDTRDWGVGRLGAGRQRVPRTTTQGAELCITSRALHL